MGKKERVVTINRYYRAEDASKKRTRGFYRLFLTLCNTIPNGITRATSDNSREGALGDTPWIRMESRFQKKFASLGTRGLPTDIRAYRSAPKTGVKETLRWAPGGIIK